MKKIFTIALILLILAAFTVPGWTQNAKVYFKQGGAQEVVASGGRITVENGGYIEGFSLKVASIVMAAADYTLSAAEALCNILVVTGSPSGQAIIAPTITGTGVSRLYVVRNAGGDSAAVLIKKSGGSTVSIATGTTAEVFWSGTQYVRKTANATH